MRDFLSMNGFKRGDHVCVLYDSDAEQLQVAAAYLAEGLSRGERCLYVADSRAALDRFCSALADAGADALAAVDCGALQLATKHQAHLIDGYFDSERMLRLLDNAVEQALNDGFTGLRTCGDMSWLLDEAPGSSQVIEYEALLSQFFQNVRAIGMCQYDRRRLSPGLLDHALATHACAVVDGRRKPNPFFQAAPVLASIPVAMADVDRKLNEIRRR